MKNKYNNTLTKQNMDKLIEETIKEVAEELNLNSETIKSVVRESFACFRQELLDMNYVKYEMPYFGYFSINRKAVLKEAERKQDERFLDILDKADNFNRSKNYYKNESEKIRNQIKDSLSK